MKSTSLLISILLFSVALFAGDWDFFPPDQKMYFYNENANALDWYSIQQTATPYVLKSNKYNNFTGTKVCAFDSTYYSIGMLEKHKWAVEELYSTPISTIYPAPITGSLPTFKDQFVYLKDIEIGQFWTLNVTDSSSIYSAINITYSSIQYVSVFGIMDSVKIFTLKGTKFSASQGTGQKPIEDFNLVVSKNYGVIEFVPFQQFIYNSPQSDFTSIKIIGIERPGFSAGITPPNFADNMHYQLGQILNWENIVDNAHIQLFRDSITAVTYNALEVSYVYNRRITDKTGNTGVTYNNNLVNTITYNDLPAYQAPPQWGDFHYFNNNTQRLTKNESFFEINYNQSDTIFRTRLTATDLLLETTICNHFSFNDYMNWEVYDKRYGLAEFGEIDQGSVTENRLVVAGPCPGIDSTQFCGDILGNIDCDNGGLSNYQECLNGTDPFNPLDDFISVFPIELSSFKAKLEDKDVTLNWITATEINSDYFEIQRSQDNSDFQKIGTVQAAQTSTQDKRYQYTDLLPPAGRLYYRLKMVDRDNSFTYSHVALVKNYKIEHQVDLFPNPIHGGDVLNLTTDTEIRADGMITIFDLTGKEVKFQQLESNAKQHIIDLQGLTQGSYLVNVSYDGKRITKKIVISN